MFSIATQRILVRFQIWQWKVKEQLTLHNVHTYNVMIQSELKYLIVTKIVNLKCWVFVGKTDPFPTVWVFHVVRPIAMIQFWVELDLEPTWEFGPVPNTTKEPLLRLIIMVYITQRWNLFPKMNSTCRLFSIFCTNSSSNLLAFIHHVWKCSMMWSCYYNISTTFCVFYVICCTCFRLVLSILIISTVFWTASLISRILLLI